MENLAGFQTYCQRRDLSPIYLQAMFGTLIRAGRDLDALTYVKSRPLEDWWNALDVKPQSRAVYASHLSCFYRWCNREGLREDNPTLRFVMPKLSRRFPRPIREDELQWAISAATEPMRTWLLLAAGMGLRAAEIAALTPEDVYDGHAIIRGKGRKERAVPLHPLVEVSRWDVTPNLVSQRARRHLLSLGIDASLHRLRHYFATNVYRLSHDLRLTQELLGHEDPKTTSMYVAWEPDRAVNVISALLFGN